MPTSTSVTELALRAAVNGADSAENLAVNATAKAKELLQGSSNASKFTTEMSAQSSSIGVAIACLTVAYTAVHLQLNELKSKRISFDKERQAGIATFIIPSQKEEINLSKYEKIIKCFVDSAKASKFSSYFGFHEAKLEGTSDSFYSVLPFYKMSSELPQQIASTKLIDQQRSAINLFFKSAFPEAISDIETTFQTDNRTVEFFKSSFTGSNYLADLRAPRFIMMCLANLLWNLEHPVDAASGFPLSTPKNIDLCREVEGYINQLLNKDSNLSVLEINNETNQLASFVRKIENHTKALRKAYAEELLHQINIEDVTNSAHHALRIMDTSVLKLIYERNNPVTGKKEHDDKAAENLAYTISYLNELLIVYPRLIDFFQAKEYAANVPAASFINTPVTTTMDIVILFTHLTYEKRSELLERLKKSGQESALELRSTLLKYDNKFVKPVRAMSKLELKGTSRENIAKMTAMRLLAFISLVIEDYRIQVDTQYSYNKAKETHQLPATKRILSGKEQVKAINLSAKSKKGYYIWEISLFINLAQATETALNKLPESQYRLSQITELLDAVSEIVHSYRSFLQLKSFQQFLIHLLENVKKEYGELAENLSEIDKCISEDGKMSRGMHAILTPITQDLSSGLDAFSVATLNFERSISSPDFTDQQKQLLSTKIKTIHTQYESLFKIDSGLMELDVSPPGYTEESYEKPAAKQFKDNSSIGDYLTNQQILVLRNLVQTCYEALSWQSKMGHKGKMFKEMMFQIDRKANLKQDDLKKIVLDLTRLCASYRPACLFQAAYGHTRSAQALITAIKDPEINALVPLASVLFNKDNLDLKTITSTQILDIFEELKAANSWSESSENIQCVTTL